LSRNAKNPDAKPVETPTRPIVVADAAAARPRPPTTLRPARAMVPAV
jgi:hypothetical protein